jgi:hypothetical protein
VLPPITGCEPAAGMEPICGFRNPDDLVQIPGTSWLLVSEFGGFDRAARGSLVLYDTASGQRLAGVYPSAAQPAAEPTAAAVPGASWGAAQCTAAPGAEFNPQGLDLVAEPGGGWRLLAVNHARAAVELFRVDAEPSPPRLRWQGCVPTGAGVFLNDVAALKTGFAATEMMPAGRFGPALAVLKSALGLNTGRVLHWDGSALVPVPDSEGVLPDGIAAAGDQLLVGEYGANRVRRIGLAGGEPAQPRELSVPHPDNLTWSGERLLLVSHRQRSLRELLACSPGMQGSCPFAFAVLAIDPQSLASQTLLEHAGGPPIGAGSAAVQVGEQLYIGTFAGDRIARARSSTAPATE